MEIIFDDNATKNADVLSAVNNFLKKIDCLEKDKKSPILIHQDGVKSAYYIRCCMSGQIAQGLLSLDARLDPNGTDSFRDNRELLLKHNTYIPYF